MVTLDAFESPNLWISIEAEGWDYHDNPPLTYEVKINCGVGGHFDWRAWQTLLTTKDEEEAFSRFYREVASAIARGEVDPDWEDPRNG